MDRITVGGIVAHGRHGASPGERDRTQALHLDLVIDADLSRAARSDELADTIDYSRVHAEIVEIVERHSYALLERLAAVILDRLFTDPRVVRAELSIAKPHLLDGATPAVTIVRER
jgi:7,8-dihydroneopterin aldolase/epimerase/oxygenase